jgi:hypothetical protein
MKLMTPLTPTESLALYQSMLSDWKETLKRANYLYRPVCERKIEALTRLINYINGNNKRS